MLITVKLFATFRQGRFKEDRRDVPAGATVADVLASLAIAPREVGMVFVRGRHAEIDRPLADDDVVSLFPLVGGG